MMVQIGPSIVYLLFETPLGSGCYIQTLTPIEPLTQRVVHNIYFQRNYPTVLAKFFMLGEALMVESYCHFHCIFQKSTTITQDTHSRLKKNSSNYQPNQWHGQKMSSDEALFLSSPLSFPDFFQSRYFYLFITITTVMIAI